MSFNLLGYKVAIGLNKPWGWVRAKRNISIHKKKKWSANKHWAITDLHNYIHNDYSYVIDLLAYGTNKQHLGCISYIWNLWHKAHQSQKNENPKIRNPINMFLSQWGYIYTQNWRSRTWMEQSSLTSLIVQVFKLKLLKFKFSSLSFWSLSFWSLSFWCLSLIA